MNWTTRIAAPLVADVDHFGGLMGGAFQCWLPGYIEARSNWTTRIAAPLVADVDHFGGLMGGALPGYIEARSNWTTRIAARLVADVDHFGVLWAAHFNTGFPGKLKYA